VSIDTAVSNAGNTGHRFGPGNPHRFQPGQVANPHGRPVSSRNKINERFLRDFQKEWEASGAKVLKEVAANHPVEFMRAACSLLPKELHLKELPLEEVDDNELARFIETVRSNRARVVGAETSTRTKSEKRKKKP
jgi:hypothetical protein